MSRKRGFTMIDNALIIHAKDLGINDFQFRLITTVLKHGRKDRLPYPSSKTIADIMGVRERRVQKESGKLQEKGYLKRPKGGPNPYWDFSPLFERLESIVTPSIGDGVGVFANPVNSSTQPRQIQHLTPSNPAPNPVSSLAGEEYIEEDKYTEKKTPVGPKDSGVCILTGNQLEEMKRVWVTLFRETYHKEPNEHPKGMEKHFQRIYQLVAQEKVDDPFKHTLGLLEHYLTAYDNWGISEWNKFVYDEKGGERKTSRLASNFSNVWEDYKMCYEPKKAKQLPKEAKDNPGSTGKTSQTDDSTRIDELSYRKKFTKEQLEQWEQAPEEEKERYLEKARGYPIISLNQNLVTYQAQKLYFKEHPILISKIEQSTRIVYGLSPEEVFELAKKELEVNLPFIGGASPSDPLIPRHLYPKVIYDWELVRPQQG